MSGKLNITEKENTDIQGFLSQSLFKNRIKEYLYGFFGQLFKTKYSSKTKLRMQIFYEVVINIIVILQLTPLWWSPTMIASGWSSYIDFWQSIAYASYDEVCAYYHIMDFCLYGTIILIGSCISSFLVFWLYIYMEKEIPLIISLLPRKIALLVTSICLIPSSMMFVMVIKYSTTEIDIIQEYAGGIPSKVYQYGPLGVFLGLFNISALIFVNCFAETFTCDVRHTHSKVNIKARSCAWYEIERRLYYIAMTILYTTFGNTDYAFAFQIAVFCLSFTLYLRIIYSMQYFNTIENSIQACKMISVSSSILFFIFAQIVNNAEILMFLTVIVTPILLFFTIRIIRRRYKNLPNSHNIPKNQFEFERNFRHLLTEGNPDDKLEVLSLFLNYWRESQFIKDKLFVIWEFNYCLYTLKDERLARIKLSKIAKAKSSFEGDVQEWRLFNWLVKKKKSIFPDTNYLEFLKQFSRIKMKDEELCFILTELQGEFAFRKPRIEKLVNLTKRAAQHISYISDGYKNLVEKHQNPEAFEIYASYLQDILNDSEESNFILRKKNGINFSNLRNEANNLKNYGKDLASILVSCSDECFGSIVYINDKASQCLKTSIGNIFGSSITNFIPQPFDAKHEDNMRRFIAECQSIDIPCHEKLFLQNNQGFLIECNILITLTAFHNCSYFLISFKPRPIIRELAIITNEGTIIAHSEMFSFYLEYPNRQLKNKNISDILPMLPIGKIHDFEPWLIPFRNTELILVKIKKQMVSTTLSIVMIIHDENEISKWKNGQHHDALVQFGTFQLFEDEESSFLTADYLKKPTEVKFHTLSTLSAITKSFEKVDSEYTGMLKENSHEKIDVESENHDKKSNNSDNYSKVSLSKKSKNNLSTYAQQLLSDSVRKIRILQWALFIVMSSVIVIVVAILVYMENDVSHTNALSSFKNFGQLIYNFGYSADLALTINRLIEKNNPDLIKDALDRLEALNEDYENIQNTILADFNQWSNCDSHEIVYKSIIPLWIFDQKEPIDLFYNLYDAIGAFMYNGEKLHFHAQTNTYFQDHAKYLFLNGLGSMFYYSNKTIDGLVTCEIDRVKSTGDTINILLICGFSALGILVLVIMGYIILVSRKYDEFWNFGLNNAQWPIFKLKCAAIDRLATTHGVDKSIETGPEEKRLTSHKRFVKGTLYLQYFWRLMLFFTIAASYYLLIFCYLYPNLDTMMKHRPHILDNFILRRSLLSRATVFSQEILINYAYNYLSDFYAFPNSELILDQTLIELRDRNNEIREGKYLDLLSHELKEKMFAKNNSTYLWLNKGTQPAFDMMIDETENFENLGEVTDDEWTLFSKMGKTIQDEIGEEFDLADRDSKDAIQEQLKIIIDTTVIYSIALCALYFFYYLPYLNYQIKQLKLFSVLPKILPLEHD